MILKNNKEVGFIYKNNQNIDKILNNNNLVFEQGFTREDSGELPLTTSHQTIGKDLKDYKVYGNSTQSSLPKEYQEVEYLQSTGTQYINTGYSPNQNSKMWLDYQLTELQSAMFAGARRTSSGARYFTINSGSSNTKMFGAFGTSGNIELDEITTNRVQTQIGNKGIYYNNVLKYTPSSTTFQLSENVLLFAVMQNSSDITLYSKVKIYGCKIWENDTLIRDFIPCYRISDNVVGMYDKANNVFYTNDGTGTFLYDNLTPTQNNPLEIKSVGDKTKNLYVDVATLYTKPVNYYICPVSLEQGTTYVMSCELVGEEITDNVVVGIAKTGTEYGDFGRFYYTLHTGTEEKYFTRTFTIDSSWTAPKLAIYASSQAQIAQIFANYHIQLEKSTQKTDYIPYGYELSIKASNGTSTETKKIYLKEPLRKVGDYADYIDFKNQKVIRKIGSYVFNENDNWGRYKVNTGNCVYNLDNTLTPLIGAPLLEPVCTHFKQVDTAGTANFNASEMRFQMSGETIGGTRIYVGASQTTLDDFKNWISLNKPELIYPLATQFEEPIILPNIPSYKVNTTYEVDTNIQPNSMYIKYKGK